MADKVVLKDLLYINEHLTCMNYVVDLTYGFHYRDIPLGTSEYKKKMEHSVVVFVIEGKCSFSLDQYLNKIFSAGDMVFLPKSSVVDIKILETSKFLYMAFDVPQNPCDKQRFEHLYEISQTVNYNFSSLRMNKSMFDFVNHLVYYLQNGASCAHLHELKHKEFFLILRWFYTKRKLAEFFYPIIGKNFDFKNFVLENYTKCTKLEQLIERSNMSPNSFMQKFKNEFGVSAYQWMLKQMSQKILHKASQSGVTVKDLMVEVGIESPSHFNRICKRYFDKTPKELIMSYREGIPK